MKKILIALDYDPLAEKVAKTGQQIAKAMDAGIILFHVIREPVYYTSGDYSPITGFTGYNAFESAATARSLKTDAHNFLEEYKTMLGDPSITTAAMEGDFADCIIDAAKKYDADMIVIGTHHRKGIEKLIMGNLSERIINNVRIPLLVVPDTETK